ncbi:MAG: hypothetical protein A2W25_12065 [candidate division Zixibacteria bacterium RBG_16_53_22]|nr:MAG: hypothetical protein A2W25_12065 [candidate division Zixibacteria bacterium RBG_16_53_22]
MDNGLLEVLERAVQVPPGADLDSPELHVTTLEEGRRYLDQYEALAFDGWSKYQAGGDQMHLAVHVILEHKLWMYMREGDRQTFFKQEDYLRNLADRMRASRSTLFAKQAELRLAIGGLGYSMDEVSQIGIQPFTIAKRFVTTDRETGEIIGFKHPVSVDGKTPKEAIREAIQSIAPVGDAGQPHDLDLTPMYMRRAMMEYLGVETPDIKFWVIENVRRGLDLGYTVEYPNGNLKKGLLAEDEVPQEVVEKLQRALHILYN